MKIKIIPGIMVQVTENVLDGEAGAIGVYVGFSKSEVKKLIKTSHGLDSSEINDLMFSDVDVYIK